MTTIQKNIQEWNTNYDWKQEGEEWSSAWGNSLLQFYSSILPRIQRFLPVKNILEIAPGFGRWTQYIDNYCEQIIGVDLSEACINFCNKKFKNHKKNKFILNDGSDLSFIKNNTIDFVFSFDSLVHANINVLENYISQIQKKFTKNGIGFIHHSNFGNFDKSQFFNINFSKKQEELNLYNSHCRDTSSTAEKFNKLCKKYHLHCISQEIVNWGGNQLIDSFSTFTKKGSKYDNGKTKYIENKSFMMEANLIKTLSDNYKNLGIL